VWVSQAVRDHLQKCTASLLQWIRICDGIAPIGGTAESVKTQHIQEAQDGFSQLERAFLAAEEAMRSELGVHPS
jgi:hypothetical protein